MPWGGAEGGAGGSQDTPVAQPGAPAQGDCNCPNPLTPAQTGRACFSSLTLQELRKERMNIGFLIATGFLLFWLSLYCCQEQCSQKVS